MTMKCPVCGGANLVSATKDLRYTYKGQTTIIQAVTGDHCPACKEVILDAENGDRYSGLVGEFQKKVNAERADPAFIAAVRVKLKIDQREAAEIFGGGVNAFSRYETGKTIPPRSLVKLLKLLDKHPQLLKEVRAA